MPQVFRIGNYSVYFWSQEGNPLEPIHVHVSLGTPEQDATKIWITSRGKCLQSHNKSKIPGHILRNIMRIIEARSEEVASKWNDYFGEIRYFC